MDGLLREAVFVYDQQELVAQSCQWVPTGLDVAVSRLGNSARDTTREYAAPQHGGECAARVCRVTQLGVRASAMDAKALGERRSLQAPYVRCLSDGLALGRR